MSVQKFVRTLVNEKSTVFFETEYKQIMILFYNKDSLFMSTGFDLRLTPRQLTECFLKTQVQLYSSQELYFTGFNITNHLVKWGRLKGHVYYNKGN